MYNPWIGGGLVTASSVTGDDIPEQIVSGEQSLDPRHWTVGQWKTTVLTATLGHLGTVHLVSPGSYSYKLAFSRSLLRSSVPVYAAYVTHDTVMNPESDYYIPPDAPIFPEHRWGYGGKDVGSRIITALADDLADVFA